MPRAIPDKEKTKTKQKALPSASRKNARKKAIDVEVERLLKIYADIQPEKLNSAQALINDVADLRVRINETKEDLDNNGYDNMFQQSVDVLPYERERPAARRLIALQKNLLAIMKELNSYLPKAETKKAEKDDGFEKFVGDK